MAAPAEDVAERRGGGAGRVHALLRLVELLRVTEEDEPLRGRGGGEHVGERHLPRLVHEEDVDRSDRTASRPVIKATPSPRRRWPGRS